jgi:hypothetical protein
MENKLDLRSMKELYNQTIRLKEQNVWMHDLEEKAIFRINLAGLSQDAYCIPMMDIAMKRGIIILIGEEAFRTYINFENLTNHTYSDKLKYIDAFYVFFADRDFLSSAERKIIKELGIKFRGKGEWITFERYCPGIVPRMLIDSEVLKLAQILEQLYHCFEAGKNKNLPVIGPTEVYSREFDKKKNSWEIGVFDTDIIDYEISVPLLNDEYILNKLREAGESDLELEIDTAFLEIQKNIIIPTTFFIDANDGEIMERRHSEDEHYFEGALSLLIDHILDFGAPKRIYVKDFDLMQVFFAFANDLEIELVYQKELSLMDSFIKRLEEELYELK